MATVEKVALGPTDLMISPLGVGTWAWGDKVYWKYQGTDAEDAALKQAFDDTLSAGINWFDTAEIYGWGRSETLVGQFERESDANVVVATKFFPYPWRLTKGALPRALKKSLKRLGREKVDLYQLHWPWKPVGIESWMDAMADCHEEGLIGAVGVSNYNVEQTERAHAALAKRGVPLASNQVEFSLLERKPETSGLLELCKKLQITVIAYSPLAQGMLSGKYSPERLPTGVRARRWAKALKTIGPLIEALREIGAKHGKNPAQVALNWTICKGTVPIPGAREPGQAHENLGALDFRMGADEVSQLDAAARSIG
jgi:aryl-alcohol dehydrogenase-like predicted oxidoreductase